jgi:thiamine-phosphate pyrophosphorylase
MYKGDYDYLFLSPIFNSISKQGYLSGFSHDELVRAYEEGIIDRKVVALGGVRFDKIEYLKGLGFGGAAMIGALYNTSQI